MKRCIRILQYTGIYAPAWRFGGPARSISMMCAGLAALGDEVTVFTTNAGLEDRPEIPIDQVVQRDGVAVHYFPATFNWMGLQSPMLEAAVAKRAGDFDLIHVTGVWQPTSRAAYRAARRAGKPYVCSPRGALGRYSFTQKPWKKWPYFWLQERANLNGAAALHFTSRMELEECRRLRLRPDGFVVPNSIDLAAWRRDEAGGRAWRHEVGAGDETFVLLYAGRIHHKKGLDLLPPALAQVRDCPWRMVFVGPEADASAAQLRAGFAAIGALDRVIFIPETGTSALSRAYSGADLFLFPSRHENFGNAAIEALACGCPVIISDQVGVADQLETVQKGAVLPREPGIWGAAIRKMIQAHPPVVRSALVERFSASVVAGRMAAEYARSLPGGS